LIFASLAQARQIFSKMTIITTLLLSLYYVTIVYSQTTSTAFVFSDNLSTTTTTTATTPTTETNPTKPTFAGSTIEGSRSYYFENTGNEPYNTMPPYPEPYPLPGYEECCNVRQSTYCLSDSHRNCRKQQSSSCITYQKPLIVNNYVLLFVGGYSTPVSPAWMICSA
jgi:hypothetical protein